DGSRILLGTTSLLVNTDNSGVFQVGTNVNLDTANGPNHALVHRNLYHATMDASGTKFLYTATDLGGAYQLAFAQLNPANLGAAPAISNTGISPGYLLQQGQSAV